MDFYGNNNNYGNGGYSRQQNQPRVYVTHSAYKFNNGESKIDPTCLTFGYWKKCLRVGICPKKAENNANTDYNAYDAENGIYIYLSHSKARILYEEVKKFISDPYTYNGVGVPTNTGLITLHRGEEFGCDSPVVTIHKLNESGEVISAFAYQFKTDFYYSIRNYNVSDGSFEKVVDDYKTMELEMFATILDEYVKSMTYATAYTVSDLMTYSNGRINEKLESIMAVTGAQLKRQNGNYGGSANVFNQASAGSNSMNMGNSYSDTDDSDLPF